MEIESRNPSNSVSWAKLSLLKDGVVVCLYMMQSCPCLYQVCTRKEKTRVLNTYGDNATANYENESWALMVWAFPPLYTFPSFPGQEARNLTPNAGLQASFHEVLPSSLCCSQGSSSEVLSILFSKKMPWCSANSQLHWAWMKSLIDFPCGKPFLSPLLGH